MKTRKRRFKSSNEIGAQYDPETGRKKGETENTGDNEGVEGVDGPNRNRNDDDENIR